MYNNKINIKLTASTILILMMIMILSYSLVLGQSLTPETVKVGINFGTGAVNNFALKSNSGMTFSVIEEGVYTDIINIEEGKSLKIRKDTYYNVLQDVSNEINYVKAAVYEGEVIGPYHIQVGEVYDNIGEAKLLLELVQSVSATVFLAYDSGWRVWTQLYLDEGQCLQQIEVIKNELKDFNYYVIFPDKKRIQVLDANTSKLLYVLNAEQFIKATPIQSEGEVGLIEYGITEHRGSICFARLENSDITVVNELSFQEYLYGVVPREIPASWHSEALKVQAVASRSYAIRSVGKHGAYGFDLCNKQHCQVYLGYSGENKSTNKAVDDTDGKTVTYSDKVITAYFSSTSGGHTENSENYWSSPLPYLRGVEDKYENSPYSNWDKLIDKSEVKQKLSSNNVDIGDIVDIKPIEISEFGRVIKLEIIGTKGSVTYEKERIRILFGYSILKSTWFSVLSDADVHITDVRSDTVIKERANNLHVMTADGIRKIADQSNKFYIKGNEGTSINNINPEVYTFRGKGYGHGLGMSQYGAKGMAEAGFDYKQILEHYYTGAKVQ